MLASLSSVKAMMIVRITFPRKEKDTENYTDNDTDTDNETDKEKEKG